jgi:hypothetical protein
MKFPIPIPETINDPRLPEICKRIFVEICGGEIVISHRDRRNERGVWKIGGIQYFSFRPFTRIQDTKLCDPWLENNELEMTVRKFPDAVNGEYLWEVLIDDAVTHRDISVQVFEETEEMARMVALLKAYNKIMEDK